MEVNFCDNKEIVCDYRRLTAGESERYKSGEFYVRLYNIKPVCNCLATVVFICAVRNFHHIFARRYGLRRVLLLSNTLNFLEICQGNCNVF